MRFNQAVLKNDQAVIKDESVRTVLSQLILSQGEVCIKKYARGIPIKTSAVELKNIPIYAHWMSLILLATDEFQVVIKIHFDDAMIEALVKSRYKSTTKSPRDLNDSFVCEILNLAGTKFKNSMKDVGIHVGMSLPIVTRGFDNYFFDTEHNTDDTKPKESSVIRFMNVWKVHLGGQYIYMSFDADILSKEIADSILDLSAPKSERDEDDDLEFL